MESPHSMGGLPRRFQKGDATRDPSEGGRRIHANPESGIRSRRTGMRGRSPESGDRSEGHPGGAFRWDHGEPFGVAPGTGAAGAAPAAACAARSRSENLMVRASEQRNMARLADVDSNAAAIPASFAA